MRKLSLLLIEDNPADAFLIRGMLNVRNDKNYQVSLVENMKNARFQLENNLYDIIISDLGLPDSHGLNTIRTVVEKLQKALLQMENDPQGKALLKKIRLKGIEVGVDREWDDVRALNIKS